MRFYYLLFLTAIFSCNAPAKRDKGEVVNVHMLEKTANDFYNQNNFQQAILTYDELLSIDSSNGEYYFKRGYSKSMLDHDSAAVVDYQKAIKYNYDKKEKAYLNIGIIYEGIVENYDSATYYIDECLKLDPNNERAKQTKKEIAQMRELLKQVQSTR